MTEPLPVFPFTDAQVSEVAGALAADLVLTLDEREHAARAALTSLARVLSMESRADPMGCPRGYGYREIRGTTNWYVVRPDGTWDATQERADG